jgi:hypothetical protein
MEAASHSTEDPVADTRESWDNLDRQLSKVEAVLAVMAYADDADGETMAKAAWTCEELVQQCRTQLDDLRRAERPPVKLPPHLQPIQ